MKLYSPETAVMAPGKLLFPPYIGIQPEERQEFSREFFARVAYNIIGSGKAFSFSRIIQGKNCGFLYALCCHQVYEGGYVHMFRVYVQTQMHVGIPYRKILFDVLPQCRYFLFMNYFAI